jgi:hypothetical protein
LSPSLYWSESGHLTQCAKGGFPSHHFGTFLEKWEQQEPHSIHLW